MAHSVKFTIPKQDLSYSDVVFEAEHNGEKLGKLKVSQGAVVWTPKNGKKGWKVSWAELGDLVKSKSRRE